MQIDAFKPAPALRPYVTDIWVYDIAREALAGAALTQLPDGFPTLCIVVGGALQARHADRLLTMRSALCGFQSRPVQVACAGRAVGLTVRFTPWGMPCLFPGPLDEATDCRIDCRDIFRRADIEDLESELAELPTALARARRVEAFLLTRLRPEALDPLVRSVASRAEPAGIAELARAHGVSERTLERRFHRAVGVAPKPFTRVLRLQHALQRHDDGSAWVDAAIDAGYYDQPHLIRDARGILGVSPDALPAPGELGQRFRALAQSVSLSPTMFC